MLTMLRTSSASHHGAALWALFVLSAANAGGQPTLGYALPTGSPASREAETALDDLRAGNYDAARKRYHLLLQTFGHSAVQDRDQYGFGLLAAVNGAAYVATLLGDFEFAESLYSRLKTGLGPPPMDLGAPMGQVQIAELKLSEGQSVAAINLLRAAATRGHSKQVLSYRYLWNLLAEACLQSGDLAGAESAFQRALDLWKGQKLREWNHRMVRGRLDRTGGKIMRAKGELAESEKLIRSALAMHDRDLAPESWDGIQDRFELGVTLHALKKYSEAEALYQSTFRTIKDRLGLRQPLAAKSLVHYEWLLRETGRDVDADKIKSFLAP